MRGADDVSPRHFFWFDCKLGEGGGAHGGGLDGLDGGHLAQPSAYGEPMIQGVVSNGPSVDACYCGGGASSIDATGMDERGPSATHTLR